MCTLDEICYNLSIFKLYFKLQMEISIHVLKASQKMSTFFWKIFYLKHKKFYLILNLDQYFFSYQKKLAFNVLERIRDVRERMFHSPNSLKERIKIMSFFLIPLLVGIFLSLIY